MRMLRRAGAVLVVLFLIVAVFGGPGINGMTGIEYVQYSVNEFESSSGLARWWRCRKVDRPLLSQSTSPWTLHYSWDGSEGPGRVEVALSSNGNVEIRSRGFSDSEFSSRSILLSDTEIEEIAAAVDDTGLLCQTGILRDGYRVYDVGRSSIKIEAGGVSRELVIDECHTLPDGRAFDAVFSKLSNHRERFGEAIDWGPFGSAVVPSEACSPRANGAVSGT